jgi:hypothetical protein
MLVACAVLLAVALSSPAQAGIPIPCSGSHTLKGGSVRDTSGQEMVLYYYIVACSKGRWESYRGADGKYHKITPNLLSSLPEPPGFWAAAWQNKVAFLAEWAWMVIVAFAVVGSLLSKLAGTDASGALSPGREPPSFGRR